MSSPLTTPGTGGPSGTPTSTPSGPDGVPVDALQAALGAEHAAVWVLELATAFVTAEVGAAVREALAAHRARRDTTGRQLRDHGVRPVPTEPAYTTPGPVVDQPTAVAALVAAESDLTSTWRAVIERTDDAGLRRSALDWLTDSAVRATRWRTLVAAEPATVALPGAPA